MDLIELIEKAKTRANLPSDYALAKALGTERQIVSGWRKGTRHPSNTEAVQLATLAGLPEMSVIAEIEYRTANTDKKREFWKSYIESRGITATACMFALGFSILLTPEPAEASVLHLVNYGVSRHNDKGEYTLCEYQGGVTRNGSRYGFARKGGFYRTAISGRFCGRSRSVVSVPVFGNNVLHQPGRFG